MALNIFGLCPESVRSNAASMGGPQQRKSMFKPLRPRQDGRHFADNICKSILLDENAWISLKISLKYVPKVLINNIPALVQIMAGLAPPRWQAITWTNDG